jgi:hypothetical protein
VVFRLYRPHFGGLSALFRRVLLEFVRFRMFWHLALKTVQFLFAPFSRLEANVRRLHLPSNRQTDVPVSPTDRTTALPALKKSSIVVLGAVVLRLFSVVQGLASMPESQLNEWWRLETAEKSRRSNIDQQDVSSTATAADAQSNESSANSRASFETVSLVGVTAESSAAMSKPLPLSLESRVSPQTRSAANEVKRTQELVAFRLFHDVRFPNLFLMLISALGFRFLTVFLCSSSCPQTPDLLHLPAIRETAARIAGCHRIILILSPTLLCRCSCVC